MDDLRDRIARAVFEGWVSCIFEGNDPPVEWRDLPLVSYQDYAACLASADAVLKIIEERKS